MTREQQVISHCDVLIAGFGPVGATLAALLGRHGLSVLVVEPEHDVYPLPRAAHFDHEIMRIFQMIGVVDAIRPHVREAPDYEFLAPDGATLMRVEREGVLGASGWPVSFNFYQPGIERALRAAVASMPNVRVWHGARFAGIVENGAEAVVVELASGGSVSACTARFLVGCDGAWSPVREALGGGLHDYAFDEPWLVLDAKVADDSRFPRNNLQICDPDRPTSFVHIGPRRLRWEFMLKPGEDAATMKSDARLGDLLAPWRRFGEIEIERRAVYRFHGLVARRWRDNRVFIAGDAAHQMPPFMGQGLCSGLRDVANLAWKLKAALAGRAGEALLDSYQIEREAHVRWVTEKAIEMGRLVCTLDPSKAAERDAAMRPDPVIAPPRPFPAMTGGCLLGATPGAGAIFPQAVDPVGAARIDDLLSAGSWLIHRGPAENLLALDDVQVTATAALPPGLARQVRRWLEERQVDAVLVRPDRYVFGSGAAEILLNAYGAWLAAQGVSSRPPLFVR